MSKSLLRATALLALAGMATAIDIELDKVTCDAGLPIYAANDGIRLLCGGEQRCTFGEEAMIDGILMYEGVEDAGLHNATAYATAELNLMTLQYELFNDLSVKFCGDWIYAQQNGNCPGDGSYHFEVPYTLPRSRDFTTWFATGWKGTAYISITNGRKSSTYDNSTIESAPVQLGYCELHFSTYTTESDALGWSTLPTAMAVSITLVALTAAMACCCCYLMCRKRRRYVTDEPDESRFQRMEDGQQPKTILSTPPVAKKVLDNGKKDELDPVSQYRLDERMEEDGKQTKTLLPLPAAKKIVDSGKKDEVDPVS